MASRGGLLQLLKNKLGEGRGGEAFALCPLYIFQMASIVSDRS